MIGIGIDLCEIARMEKLKDDTAFLQRYFTQEERAYLAARGKTAAQSMAAMFAAKEALLKAMGIGIGGGIPLADIAVEHAQSGKPAYRLTGMAAQQLEAMDAKRAWLSLTHEAGLAAAVAVIE